MLKKSVTYKNFNNEVVTEDFYFHMTKTEAVELEVNLPGGLAAYARLVGANAQTNPGALIDLFKKIVRLSYGVRSEDGKYFRKSDQAWNDFVDCGAYSVFFLDLIGNSAALADFINAAIGESLSEDGKKITAADIEAKTQELVPANVVAVSNVETSKPAGKNIPKAKLQEMYLARLKGSDDRPAFVRENRAPTVQELTDLSEEEFEKYKDEISKHLS